MHEMRETWDNRLALTVSVVTIVDHRAVATLAYSTSVHCFDVVPHSSGAS